MADEKKSDAPKGGAQGAVAPNHPPAGDKPTADPRDAELAALRKQLAEANAAKERSEKEHEATFEELAAERNKSREIVAGGLAELRGAQGAPGVVRLSERSGPVRRFVAKSTLVLALDGDRTKVGEGEEFEATADELAGLTAGVHFERL